MDPRDEARQIGTVNSWKGQYRAFGEAVHGAAGTLIADTGAMDAGYYDVFFVLGISVEVGTIQLAGQWRNAANTATLVQGMIMGSLDVNFKNEHLAYQYLGVKVEQDERFRIIITIDSNGRTHGGIVAVRRA